MVDKLEQLKRDLIAIQASKRQAELSGNKDLLELFVRYEKALKSKISNIKC